MFYVREITPDVFAQVETKTAIISGEGDNRIKHPPEILTLWTDADLAAIDIYRVPEEPVADGYQSTGFAFQRVDGIVKQVHSIEPIPEPVEEPKRCISAFEFLSRFTQPEFQAISAAALQSPELYGWVTRAVAAQEIDLQHQDTVAGMVGLVNAGLITTARSDEILAVL